MEAPERTPTAPFPRRWRSRFAWSFVGVLVVAVLAGGVWLRLSSSTNERSGRTAQTTKDPTPAVPDVEEVGVLAQEQVSEDLAALVQAVGSDPVASGYVSAEGTMSAEALLAYMASDATVVVVETRPLESDDSVVIVTFEMTSSTITGTHRWEEAYRRVPGGMELISVADFADMALGQ